MTRATRDKWTAYVTRHKSVPLTLNRAQRVQTLRSLLNDLAADLPDDQAGLIRSVLEVLA